MPPQAGRDRLQSTRNKRKPSDGLEPSTSLPWWFERAATGRERSPSRIKGPAYRRFLRRDGSPSELGAGQHIVVFGATGAGKATTARRLIAARTLAATHHRAGGARLRRASEGYSSGGEPWPLGH
jgi:hypothetical protein